MIVTSSTSANQTYAAQNVTATKAAGAYESTASATQTTDKMEAMKQKYADLYTPIPETYSKADEALQAQKIYEAYPDYIPPNELFAEAARIYTEEYGEKPIQLGDAPLTEEQQAKQAAAFEKVFAPYGGAEAYNEMVKEVFEIQKQYPVNSWGKEGLENAKELSRFYNAGVYEGLESGMSLDDAKQAASSAMFSYMGTSSNKVMLRAMPNPELGIEGSDLFNAYVQYEKQAYNYDTNIDLREHDIDGWWRDNDLYQSDSAMIAEIQKKIEQFTFMLENTDLLEEAIDEMDVDDRPDVSSYQRTAREEELPEARLALKIFQNYNIYDRIDTVV
jgi:hypothetical protein